MTRPIGLRPTVFLLCSMLAGCQVEYECADACAKVYDECGTAVEAQGVPLAHEQCELVCEEGKGDPEGAASLWLDCIEDSVCPGQVADQEERDLERYDVDWCSPQFELLILAS
jgi:hypothetical protein